jgi:hypothetical protein
MAAAVCPEYRSAQPRVPRFAASGRAHRPSRSSGLDRNKWLAPLSCTPERAGAAAQAHEDAGAVGEGAEARGRMAAGVPPAIH